MSSWPLYLLWFVLQIALPATTVFAAGMVAVRPPSAVARGVVLACAVAATAVCAWRTIESWWPDDALWDGLHAGATLVSLAAAAGVVWLGRAEPGSAAAKVLRPLLVVVLFASAVLTFLVVAGGSGR